jgi:hypothetical protein
MRVIIESEDGVARNEMDYGSDHDLRRLEMILSAVRNGVMQVALYEKQQQERESEDLAEVA